MLKHAKGNLIDMAEAGMFDVIVHGCNCQNTMGSGIAKEIRARYPEAYVVDTEYHKALAFDYGEPFVFEKLGNFSTYTTFNFIVINAYTQLHYLPRGVDHFEYESFYLILKKLEALGGVRFGFPYIGMGLAGGDETRIIKMLIDFANKITDLGGSVTLVEFSG